MTTPNNDLDAEFAEATASSIVEDESGEITETKVETAEEPKEEVTPTPAPEVKPAEEKPQEKPKEPEEKKEEKPQRPQRYIPIPKYKNDIEEKNKEIAELNQKIANLETKKERDAKTEEKIKQHAEKTGKTVEEVREQLELLNDVYGLGDPQATAAVEETPKETTSEAPTTTQKDNPQVTPDEEAGYVRDEWNAIIPNIKKQFPNATDEMLEEAFKEFDELSHDPTLLTTPAQVIFDAKVKVFDEILNRANAHTMENGKPAGPQLTITVQDFNNGKAGVKEWKSLTKEQQNEMTKDMDPLVWDEIMSVMDHEGDGTLSFRKGGTA